MPSARRSDVDAHHGKSIVGPPGHAFQLRGDKVSAIAAAFGCKVATVYVARARFGLKPRRSVPGRPRQEPDEPTHKIERVVVITSRLMEFCTEKELVAQTGHESHQWPLVVIKELTDNAIDACEEAEVAPVIKIAITTGKRGKATRIVVGDNGPGISTETISGIIDYDVRVSSREAHISPTRGRQGNALKTLVAMSYVLGDQAKGETWIESRGVKHRIVFSVNQIKQQPIVKDIRTRSRVTTGTRVTVFWPDTDKAIVDAREIADRLRQFIWVNPHLTLQFIVDGKTRLRHSASNPDWSKYRACDATSAHWYSLEQFERYAGALIDRDLEFRKRHPRSTREKVTVRDFIAQFRGMSATDKQKEILRELGAAHVSLHQFFGSETQVNHQRMQKLLRLLQKHTRSVRPESLGIIGEEHLRRLCISVSGEEKSFKYFISPNHNADGLPYVVEIATCPYKQWVHGKNDTHIRKLITGVNFSSAKRCCRTTLTSTTQIVARPLIEEETDKPLSYGLFQPNAAAELR
jgi:hypothetical protein